MKRWGLVLGVFALAACTQQAMMTWVRVDGSTGPAIQQQFELDRIACEGEMQRANMQSNTYCRGIADCVVTGAIRGQQMQTVGKGCMADRGYIHMTVEEANVRAAEAFAAANPPPEPPAVAAPKQAKAKKQVAAKEPRQVSAPPPVGGPYVPVAVAAPPEPPEPQLSARDRTMNSRN